MKRGKGGVCKERGVKKGDRYLLGDGEDFSYKDWLIEGRGSSEVW